MDRWATKDRNEREDEESQRLIRPSPKLKPPRRDLRRETVNPDRDPDIDDDPDIARDKDLSLNYKNVGGSTARVLSRFMGYDPLAISVAGRFLRRAELERPFPKGGEVQEQPTAGKKEEASGGDERVRAWNKKKKKVVYVSQKALKEHPDKYEARDAEDKEAPGEGEEEAHFYELGQKLREKAKGNEQIQQAIDVLKQPGSGTNKQWRKNPKTPLNQTNVGETARQLMPLGIKTLDDLHKAIHQQRPDEEEEEEEASKPEEPKPGPKKEDAGPGPEMGAAPEGPPPGALPEPQADTAENWVAKGGHKSEDFKAWAREQKTIGEAKDGTPLFRSQETKQLVPFEKLSPEEQEEFKERFDKHTRHLGHAKSLQEMGGKDPNTERVLRQLADPDSALRTRIERLKMESAGEGVGKGDLSAYDIKKALPELKDVELPEGLDNLQDFVDAADKAYPQLGEDEGADLQKWIKDKTHKKKDFREWAKGQKNIVEKGGELLFQQGKKKVPFEDLPPDAQAKVKSRFESDEKVAGNVSELKKLAKNPETKALFRKLGKPGDPLRERIENALRKAGTDPEEADVNKAVPELAKLGVKLPDSISSVKELFDAVDKAYAPPPEPERSKPSTQAALKAKQDVAAELPEDIANEVAGMDLHPDDVSTLISFYRASMARPEEGARDVDSLVKTLTGGGYHPDLENIDVPDKGPEGEVFEDLPPEEQATAFAKHKMKMLAASFAARERVTSALKNTGLPSSVAKRLSQSMLTAGDHDPDPGEVRSFYKDSLVTASYHEPLTKEQVDHLLKLTGGNPAARKYAVAYLQAKDYADARKQFLEKDREHPDRQITEYDNPKDIAKKLETASEFLKQRSARYPSDAVSEDTAMEFRNRIVDRMAALNPQSVPIIRGYLKDYEVHEFDQKAKAYTRDAKAYTKAFEAEEKAHRKEVGESGEEGYRTPQAPHGAYDEDVVHRLAKKGVFPPRKPTPPPGYEYAKDPEKTQAEGDEFWKWFQNLYKRKPKKKAAAEILTVEERVAARHLYSSYSGCWTMGPSVRTALYWGQEPYETTEAYLGWTQAQARDFEAKDFDGILAAAREWMKVPVLGRAIKGLYPDTQFRAALDLALRDHENGKYSVGLYPTVYNELLAKLSGQPGPYELSTTKPADVPTAGVKNAVKSTYGATNERGLQTMKASQELRQFAARAAATTKDAELAFDLIALADRLAAEEAESSKQEQAGQQQGQEGQAEQQKQAAIRVAATQINKFNSVRALVVKQAMAFPQLREVFLPILQACKG